MKIKLLLLFFLLVHVGYSQKLNKYGHFERANISDPELTQLIRKNHPGLFHEHDENSLMPFDGGMIYLSGNCSSVRTNLRVFDRAGKEKFSKTFDQAQNFKLAPGRKHCAFFEGKNIVVIDLANLSERKIPGSSIFFIDDMGQLACFNKTNQSVCFQNNSSLTTSEIYKAFIYEGRALFFSREEILELDGNNLVTIFSTNTGRVFDISQFGNRIYISVKFIEENEFVFRAYSSKDLTSFRFEEEIGLPRIGHEIKAKHSLKKQSDTREFVRDPLFYFQDTVYHGIGNSYGEIQDYGSPPYLHPGVDLFGDVDQEVRSVKKGYVKAILTTNANLHWRIAISNENTSNQSIGYLYAHLNELSIPYAVGDSVEEGDQVGTLVDFGGFNHCHFARITDTGSTWFGGWWTLDNPLSFISTFYDTVPPVFEMTIFSDLFAFRDINGNYLSPDSLYGGVRIISKFYDIVNSHWHVDVDKIRFSLSPLLAPGLMLIDTLSLEFNFYTDQYSTGIYTTNVLNTIYSRDNICFSIGNYSDRNFYHIISSSDGNDTIDGNDSLQLFNTMDFADGSYILRVNAIDAKGNSTVDSMIIRIINYPTIINEDPVETQIKVFPNPSSVERFYIELPKSVTEMKIDVYDEAGKLIKTGRISEQNSFIDIPVPGFYTLRLYDGKKYYFRKLARL